MKDVELNNELVDIHIGSDGDLAIVNYSEVSRTAYLEEQDQKKLYEALKEKFGE